MRIPLARTSVLLAAAALLGACGEGAPTTPAAPSQASGGPGSIGTQPTAPRPPGGPVPQGEGWSAARVSYAAAGAPRQSATRPVLDASGRLAPGPWSYARGGADGRVVLLSYHPTGGGRGDLLVLQINPYGWRYGSPLRCFVAGDGECHGRLLRGVDPARMRGPGRWWSEWHEVVGGTITLAEQAAGGVRGSFALQAADVDGFVGSDWTSAPRISLSEGSFEVGFGADAAVMAAMRCVEGAAAGHGCADPAGLSTAPLAPGTFEAVVTGDTIATLAGAGRWSLSPYGEGFIARLASAHPGAHGVPGGLGGSGIALLYPAEGPPVPGTYPVHGAQPSGASSIGVSVGLAPLAGFGVGLAVESGTVTITRVTESGGVEGTFDVTGGGRSYDPADTRTYRIRAQGRFHLTR